MFLEKNIGATEKLNPRKASNGHLPYHLFILLLSARARCMKWRVNLRAQ